MELAEGNYPTVNILGVTNEICQIILLSIRAQTAPKICLSIKNKGQASQTGLNLVCFKVTCSESVPFIRLFEENCLPQLCRIICEMQNKEKESHVALQVVNESNCKLQKEMLLWLDTNKDTSSLTVTILNETVKEVDTVDHISTTLEIRVFVTVSNIIQSSKGVLDLLERIKFLNPKVQLSFSLYSLTSVEVDLCSTCSISCETFDIYSGYDIFLRKNSSQFTCQTMKVKSSKRLEIQFLNKDSVMETVCLTCISCFAPMCTTQYDTNDDDPGSCPSVGQDSRGQIRIQVYGPGNLPSDMNIVTEKLALTPDSLLPWQKLGFQVKKSFSCSSYDLHCSARITNKAVVPSWAAQCQQFCVMLAFILNWREIKSDDIRTIFKHQEFFQYLEQQVLNKEVYSTFQKAAYTSLADLLSQDKFETIALQQQQKPLSPKRRPSDSELFKKMIPDVVNSLTDIFIRSTSVDFRSQVGTIVPTSSRVDMTSFLEKSLWRMVCKPEDNSENTNMPDQAVENTEGAQVDDWDISQDSLFSMKEDGTMSPDSLDLEWESACSTANFQDTANTYIESLPDEFRGASCSNVVQQNILNEDSLNGQSNASFSWSSQLNFESSEKELELWEHAGDALTSFSADICSIDTNAAPFLQEKTDCQHLYSASFSGDSSASTLKCVHENISISNEDQSVKNLKQDSIAPLAHEKMPRKRSSESFDYTVSDEEYHVYKSTDVLEDRKKQRFQNSVASSNTNLSHCTWLATLCSEEPDNYVAMESEYKHFLEVENTFASCWFDEEEIASWYADLDF